jgi:hypothetical protein
MSPTRNKRKRIASRSLRKSGFYPKKKKDYQRRRRNKDKRWRH